MTGRGHSCNNSLCHKAKLHFDRNFTLPRGKTSLAKQTSPLQEIPHPTPSGASQSAEGFHPLTSKNKKSAPNTETEIYHLFTYQSICSPLRRDTARHTQPQRPPRRAKAPNPRTRLHKRSNKEHAAHRSAPQRVYPPRTGAKPFKLATRK